jgi:hypothetical protein
MKKLIYGEPICNTDVCCHHDPNYPSNCAIMTSCENCGMAEVVYPRRLQRALAWLDRHQLSIGLGIVVLTIIIWVYLLMWSAISNAVIEDLRQELYNDIDLDLSPDKERQLYVKHGRPFAVIYSPGKTPYYINKAGQKCKFV